MTRIIKISCESCKKNVTHQSRYYLDNILFGTVLVPPICGAKDFCSLGCLQRWVNNQ